MAIICFSCSKGGVGKSTAALVLGTTLARMGATVTIVDADPNKQLLAWKDGPSKNPVEIIRHEDEGTIGRTLKAEATRKQFVIADLEGVASLMVAAATLAADLVIVPTRGSALDAAQVRRTLSLLEDQAAAAAVLSARPYRVLFNGTTPRFATRDEKLIRKTMTDAGVPVLRTDLNERAPFRAMFMHRLDLTELNPAAVSGVEKAQQNAIALANEVAGILRASRRAA